MGYQLEFNCLLVVSKEQLELASVEVGKHYQVEKDGERLYLLNIPIEICDEDYNYFGKVAIRKLAIETNKTVLDVEVLKLFDDNERAVYTRNFIKPD